MNFNEAKQLLNNNGYILEAEEPVKKLTQEEAIEKYGSSEWDMTDEAKAELQQDPVYKEYYKMAMDVIENEIHKNDPDAQKYLKTIYRYYDGSPEEELALKKSIFYVFINSAYPHVFYWGPRHTFHDKFENTMFLRHLVKEYLDISPAYKEMSEIKRRDRGLETVSAKVEHDIENKKREEKLKELRDAGCKCSNCAYFDMSRRVEKFGLGYEPEGVCMYKSCNRPHKWSDICIAWKNRYPKKEEN